MTSEMDRPCFTVCVFQDPAWADRGLEALRASGFDGDSVSVLAKQSEGAEALFKKLFTTEPLALNVKGLGPVVAHGPLISALQGPDDGLGQTGVAATIRRVGFQAHDGFIYETLTERGGILVAVESEPRAADALSLFHSYGGGNAAIGAWSGRV